MLLKTNVVVTKTITKEIPVTLEASRDGAVHLKVDDFYVVTLTPDGKLSRAGGIPERVGLAVDKNGRIQME